MSRKEAGTPSQAGRGGMGSHKHATSGHSGPSPRYKQNRTREANQEAAKEAELRAKKKQPMFGSVAEALKNSKPR